MFIFFFCAWFKFCVRSYVSKEMLSVCLDACGICCGVLFFYGLKEEQNSFDTQITLYKISCIAIVEHNLKVCFCAFPQITNKKNQIS